MPVLAILENYLSTIVFKMEFNYTYKAPLMKLSTHQKLKLWRINAAKIISYEITKLGKYLKQLREELGLSIRSVAIKCKLAPSYLSKIEAGDTFKTIGVNTLVGLSKFYNIPVAHLLKESGFTETMTMNCRGFSAYLRKNISFLPKPSATWKWPKKS